MVRTSYVPTREKGQRFEREVAKLFEAAGCEVRHLARTGDRLLIGAGSVSRHLECKRQERLRIPQWLEQVERDTPEGVPWLIVFRQSGQAGYTLEPLAARVELERRLLELERQVADLELALEVELEHAQMVAAAGERL